MNSTSSLESKYIDWPLYTDVIIKIYSYEEHIVKVQNVDQYAISGTRHKKVSF